MRTTHSAQETMDLGREIARKLRGGEIISLIGDLGGGKTTFTKGIAEELKIDETITSPTFVLLKNYPGHIDDKNIELVHIDAYRCETIEDIKSVGIEDYLGRDDVILVIEWADKIKEILPANIIDIKFAYVDENSRRIGYDFKY